MATKKKTAQAAGPATLRRKRAVSAAGVKPKKKTVKARATVTTAAKSRPKAVATPAIISKTKAKRKSKGTQTAARPTPPPRRGGKAARPAATGAATRRRTPAMRTARVAVKRVPARLAPVEVPQWGWAPPALAGKVKASVVRAAKKPLLASRQRRRVAATAVSPAASAVATVSTSTRRTPVMTAARKRALSKRAQLIAAFARRAKSLKLTRASQAESLPPAERRATAASDRRSTPRPAPGRRAVDRQKARRTERARRQSAKARPGSAPVVVAPPVRVKRAKPAAVAAPPPAPKRKGVYLDYGPTLPERYHDDRMFAMVRDPEWVYVYWELSDGKLPALIRRYGRQAVRRGSWRLLGRDGGSQRFATGLVAGETGSWYCKVGAQMTVQFSLVLRLPDGRAIEVLRSNTVRTPRLWPSERTDAAWYVSEEQFVGRYISDYEPPYTSGQGRSFPGFTIPVPSGLPGSGRVAAQPAGQPAMVFPEFYLPENLPSSGTSGRSGAGQLFRRRNLTAGGRAGR